MLFRSPPPPPGRQRPRRFQSAKRICAVSKAGSAPAYSHFPPFQSAKRICAVSKCVALVTLHPLLPFQSAKRICAVSKNSVRSESAKGADVSIRQADLCCFEGNPGRQVGGEVGVSIRQADLCCFEVLGQVGIAAPVIAVSIRQADLCCFEGHRLSGW